MISELDIGFATLTFGLALNVLWKRALHLLNVYMFWSKFLQMFVNKIKINIAYPCIFTKCIDGSDIGMGEGEGQMNVKVR